MKHWSPPFLIGALYFSSCKRCGAHMRYHSASALSSDQTTHDTWHERLEQALQNLHSRSVDGRRA